MQMMLKVFALLAVSGCIVTGQALLAVLARRLVWPPTWGSTIEFTLLNPLFYACILVYALGVLGYAALLRFFPLAQVTISLMVLMIAMTLGYNHVLGHHLSALQWLGAVLATIGLIALNS